MKRILKSLTVILILCSYSLAIAGESIEAAIDKDLKAIWASMINRLSAGDIDGALGYFTYSSRWKYKEEFTLVKERMTEMSSKMKKIEPVYIRDDEAKYRVRAGDSDDEYTYYVWFRKDIFGIWKIDKF